MRLRLCFVKASPCSSSLRLSTAAALTKTSCACRLGAVQQQQDEELEEQDLEEEELDQGEQQQQQLTAHSLLQLPEEMLHLIMGHLPRNAAVRLGSTHSTLRRIFRALTSLQPSLVLDVTAIRGRGRTPAECAAKQMQQQRSHSFRAFRAANPGIAIDALTLRLVVPAVPLGKVQRSAGAAILWLPLRQLKRLCLETSADAAGVAQVNTPLLPAIHMTGSA